MYFYFGLKGWKFNLGIACIGMFVSAAEAARFHHVGEPTVRLWARQGLIEHTTTLGGHYRYKINAIAPSTPADTVILYARVSTRKQATAGDQQRQIERLQAAYPNGKLIEDIASGINFKRPGLRKVVDAVLRGTVQKVVVTERDRLTRFGFDFLEWLFGRQNAHIECLSSADKNRHPQQDFVDDLLSIITVFTASHHGKRAHQRKGSDELIVPEVKAVPEQAPEDPVRTEHISAQANIQSNNPMVLDQHSAPCTALDRALAVERPASQRPQNQTLRQLFIESGLIK